MGTPLKYAYNEIFIEKLCANIRTVVPSFKSIEFSKSVFTSDWDSLELKQRMRHISLSLRPFLSKNTSESLDQIVLISHACVKTSAAALSFEYMFLSDYIEIFGKALVKESLDAIEEVTKYTSCEFAIRPLIIKHTSITMQRMLQWSSHHHPSVRRLSSEGCRPRLPWAMALPDFKKNPSPIIPILENLKNDSSEYVRKSVANNVNDISKDNPNVAKKLISNWHGKTKHTNWICKHASRTLLKAGDVELMNLFGLGTDKNISISNFSLAQKEVSIGDFLEFSFDLENREKEATLIRLEYAVYYLKANGSLSKKVYKISEKSYPPLSLTAIKKRQSFKLISTRVFHLGMHKIAPIINGKELQKLPFILN